MLVESLVDWASDMLAFALTCFQVEELAGVAAAWNASLRAT